MDCLRLPLLAFYFTGQGIHDLKHEECKTKYSTILFFLTGYGQLCTYFPRSPWEVHYLAGGSRAKQSSG